MVSLDGRSLVADATFAQSTHVATRIREGALAAARGALPGKMLVRSKATRPAAQERFFTATRVDRQLLGAEACTGSLFVAPFDYPKRFFHTTIRGRHCIIELGTHLGARE